MDFDKEIIFEKLQDKIFNSTGLFGSIMIINRLKKLEIEERKNKTQIMWAERYYDKWLNNPEIDESSKAKLFQCLEKAQKRSLIFVR